MWYKNTHNKIGRLIFDTEIIHLSKINLEIKNVKLIINKLVKKDISINIKFKNEDVVFQTNFTNPIEPTNIDINKKQISYSWINSENEKLILLLNSLGLNDLSNSSLSLNIYDTKLEKVNVENYNHKLYFNKFKEVNGETLTYKLGDCQGNYNYNIHKLISENSNTLTKQSSIIFKQASTFHKSLYPKKNSDSKVTELANKKENNDKNNINIVKDNVNDKKSLSTNQNISEEINFQVFENLEKVFCEELYFNGKLIGTLEGRICVKNIPLIKQTICGVHTERGFDISSHYLTYNENSTNNQKNLDNDNNNITLKEVRDLENLTNKLIVKLTESSGLTTVNKKAKESNQEILEHLNELYSILSISSKDTCLYYNYNNQFEILKSQEIMLKLGNYLISIIDNLRIEHLKESLKIISTLLNRAEFDLGTLAYNIDYDNNDTLVRRIILCYDFIVFLNNLVTFITDKFAKKVSDKDIQTFIEYAFSVCYFRSPKFRKSFLEAISMNSDFNLGNEDIRTYSDFNYTYMKNYVSNQHYNMSYTTGLYKNKDELYINPIVTSIDWKELFYDKLDSLLINYTTNNNIDNIKKEYTSFIINNSFYDVINKIDEPLNKKDWKQRISRRNLGFLSIIKNLENYIRVKIIVNRDISWEDIPGFDNIIMSILFELKSREVAKYPKLLIDVLICFVNNSSLMNLFFYTISKRTNIHDTNAVYNFLNAVDMFFHSADVKISNLKLYFDYNLLKECFKIIFEVDHSLCVAKLFWFLFENCHLLNEEHMYGYITELIQNNFYKYFFHWSFQVRHVFFHFILYSLLHRITNSQDYKVITGINITNINPQTYNKSINNRRQPQQISNYNTTTSNNNNISNGNYIINNSSYNINNNFLINNNQSHAAIQDCVKIKLSEVDFIIELLEKKDIDMYYNNILDSNDIAILKSKNIKLNNSLKEFIVVSIRHFKPIYKDYESWIEKLKKNKPSIIPYPDMTITQLKDDVIEYTENWS